MRLRGTRRRAESLLENVGELVDAHERTCDLTDFERYRNDPIGFITDVLDEEPWSRQEDIAESVRKNPLVLVQSANGIGKDWLAARLALWWVYAHQGRVLLTGPTQRQVVEIVMKEVARAFAGRTDLPGELYQSALRLGQAETAGILAFTSRNASQLTGFHSERLMAILTEAQGIESFAWEAMHACATGAKDKLLALGNPLRPEGAFYRAARSKDWETVRIPASEHPNLTQQAKVIPGGPSPQFVERIHQEFGEDSAEYTARVEGRFPESIGSGLVPPGWFNDAVDRYQSDPDRWESKAREDEWALGLDVGDGRDPHCLAGRRGPLLSWVRVVETKGDRRDDERAVKLASEAMNEVSGLIRVDRTGVGAGPLGQLSRRFPGSVEGENFGASPEQEADRFRNRRAEIYWRLRERFRNGTVAIRPPQSDDRHDSLRRLREELAEVRYEIDGKGRIALEAKSQFRQRIGRSPDAADAVAMAFAPIGLRQIYMPR